jgi:hypothetical protein
LGGGGAPVRAVAALTVVGNAGGNYGGGASGSANGESQSAQVGAAGAPGVVIVWEFVQG